MPVEEAEGWELLGEGLGLCVGGRRRCTSERQVALFPFRTGQREPGALKCRGVEGKGSLTEHLTRKAIALWGGEPGIQRWCLLRGRGGGWL